MASKLLPVRRLSSLLKPRSSSFSSIHRLCIPTLSLLEASRSSDSSSNTHTSPFSESSRSFCSTPLSSEGPAAIDYSSLLTEDEYHTLADSTIHDLQEKFEEYGDCVQVDGFDIDYGNQVLTLKLGSLGTYVLNKQTPNRQLWLSSPARYEVKGICSWVEKGNVYPSWCTSSGPARFDWDRSAQAWVYRRNKANLLKVLETELEELCGVPINLS